jgi:hypothetical protein
MFQLSLFALLPCFFFMPMAAHSHPPEIPNGTYGGERR